MRGIDDYFSPPFVLAIIAFLSIANIISIYYQFLKKLIILAIATMIS